VMPHDGHRTTGERRTFQRLSFARDICDVQALSLQVWTDPLT
jgi:hypothetical protein